MWLFSVTTSNIIRKIILHTHHLLKNIVNSQEINIAQIENQLHNWSIPHMKINTIYQEGNFEFNQNLESLQLLSQNTINHHRKKFNYIHIGLV